MEKKGAFQRNISLENTSAIFVVDLLNHLNIIKWSIENISVHGTLGLTTRLHIIHQITDRGELEVSLTTHNTSS